MVWEKPYIVRRVIPYLFSPYLHASMGVLPLTSHGIIMGVIATHFPQALSGSFTSAYALGSMGILSFPCTIITLEYVIVGLMCSESILTLRCVLRDISRHL